MLAHLAGPQLPGILQYTFTGHPAVIAFFVISGFCIHHPYVGRPLPATAFLVARAIRILPPVLAAMAAAAWVGVKYYNFVDGYILWSVVCELWYYALYPAFFALSRYVSWRSQWLASFVLASALVLVLESNHIGSAHIYGPWLNWIVALPSWLLGCVLADGIRNPVGHVWAFRLATALTASVLYWLTMNTAIGYNLTLNAFALLVAAWMLAEIEAGGTTLFDWVGTWSFSIYLWHAIVNHVSPREPVIAIALTLLGCYVAYRLIERPFHLIARRVAWFLTPVQGNPS